ncbi:hypothetical protein M9Y10_008646 [Tritrichomonas musculus]|uniref:Uncharacterized protein n=1 Tax=Tritrichomonas musculus TaxID=1915356 RepID=A0ABR2IYY2_9EUKA
MWFFLFFGILSRFGPAIKSFAQKSIPKSLGFSSSQGKVKIQDVQFYKGNYIIDSVINGNKAQTIAKENEDGELEVEWTEEKDSQNWIYSHPSESIIDSVMKLLEKKLASIEPPELVQVVSFRTKIHNDADIKRKKDIHQAILKISLFNHLSLHMVEFSSDKKNHYLLLNTSVLADDEEDM